VVMTAKNRAEADRIRGQIEEAKGQIAHLGRLLATPMSCPSRPLSRCSCGNAAKPRPVAMTCYPPYRSCWTRRMKMRTPWLTGFGGRCLRLRNRVRRSPIQLRGTV
jgi:hypothetical protein